MSRVRPSPMACLASLQVAARAAAEPDQPRPLFDAVHHALDKLVGAKLFTMLRIQPDGSVERLFSNQPALYPVGGRKPRNETRWTRDVIDAQRHFLGRDYEALREVFFDHEAIRALGCESVINVLVRYDGRVVGLVNMLHEADWYDSEDIAIAEPFAQLLVPAFAPA